ncbi:MAG TPA: hypothetical protein ENJ35_05195, partial [Gammaproteobacteria bacterium]|nr:hypothetical protein [Gammaproteobacteria bacterium]
MEISARRDLVEALLAESNPERLKVLIRRNMSLMDAALFQALKEAAADPQSREQFHQIVSTHLRLSGENWYDHYEIAVQMGKAWESGTLDAYLNAHRELITPELIATLVQSAEDGIANVGFLQTGLMLLKIAEADADRFDIQTHRSHLYLTLSSYHLYMNQNDEARRAIT